MKRQDPFTISMFVVFLTTLSVLSLRLVMDLSVVSKVNVSFGFAVIFVCTAGLLVLYFKAAGLK